MISRTFLHALILTTLSTLAAAADRPLDPLALADFEQAADLAAWNGLEVSQDPNHASSGKHGMAFDIPVWDGIHEDQARPGVRLAYADGAGFPFTDWRGYGTVAIDFWMEGAKEGMLGIKLCDRSGTSSWTTHITLTPGRMYTAELDMDDVAADIDPANVQEVVLYSLRPKAAFQATVDQLRLLPREKPPIAQFTLTYPNYRGWIFPGENEIEVAANIQATEYGYRPGELEMVLTLEGKDTSASRRQRAAQDTSRYTLPLETCTEGPITFTAQLLRKRGKRLLAQQRWTLEKLAQSQVDALPVYVDRHGNTIAGGKPFFPLGFYAGASLEQYQEIAGTPFNTILAYGTNRLPKAEMEKHLDALEAAGLKLVYSMNDVYPRATYLNEKGWEGITGNEAIARAVVETYRDHPALLAWYLNDELPREQRPELLDYFRRMKRNDPGHPTFIVLCQKKDFPYLWDTADIVAGDPYPIPKEPLTRVSDMMLKSKAPSLGTQAVWLVPQSFAWYQHTSKNPDRSHLPTEEELLTGRAPTQEEARCMTYLALAHGAKGIIYWCYYNMRMLPQYEEMWAWMQSLGEEVQTLSPMLLAPGESSADALAPEASPLHTLLKRHDGTLYLIAVNPEPTACRATFDWRSALPGKVDVLFEDRSLPAQGSTITDDFAPLGVHVYAATAP